MLILNVAGGKIGPLDINSFTTKYVVNVDNSYYGAASPEFVENDVDQWNRNFEPKNCVAKVNEDIFTFMERTTLQFDRVAIYRFLEHVSFTQVPYFIYLISTITKPGALVDVIVPNYETLAMRIVNEGNLVANEGIDDFSAWDIELTTELLNEPSCPHASIWTPFRAQHFWELEGRFKIIGESMQRNFTFDGRSIYLRFFLERV